MGLPDKMDSYPERIPGLINKSLGDTLTIEEAAELNIWLGENANRKLYEDITKPEVIRHGLFQRDKYNVEGGLRKLYEKIATPKKAKIISLNRTRTLVAASIILVIGTSLLLVYQFSNKVTSDPLVTTAPSQIKPGSNRATLGRADGTTVDLNTANNGVIAKEPGADVTKTADGQLVYKVKDGKPEMNWIATPKGGQYQVTLPDGSKVKLNAESRLDYPTAFTGSDRTVTLSGEGFFEVKKDLSKPFYVQAKNLNVKVTGTSFNLNTYGNEIVVKGTLFEGKITAGDDYVKFDLKPGEEIQYDSATKQYRIVKADLDGAAAWRNGLFNLENADIPALFREISRWYSIDIVYANSIPQGNFSGQIHRDLEFPELLRVLNQAGISTRVEGNKLIVL